MWFPGLSISRTACSSPRWAAIRNVSSANQYRGHMSPNMCPLRATAPILCSLQSCGFCAIHLQAAGVVLPKCGQRRGHVHQRGHWSPQGAQPPASRSCRTPPLPCAAALPCDEEACSTAAETGVVEGSVALHLRRHIAGGALVQHCLHMCNWCPSTIRVGAVQGQPAAGQHAAEGQKQYEYALGVR